MVLLNIELDNFLLFNNFSMNLTFPKKPVRSLIECEHIEGRTNFRYKKAVILMGANATGKTALGKMLKGIFVFIARRELSLLAGLIEDPTKDASFSIDIAFSEHTMYRIATIIKNVGNRREIRSENLEVRIWSEPINKNDNYERCVERIESRKEIEFNNYVQALESVPFLTWKFEDPFYDPSNQRIEPVAPEKYTKVLERTLKTIDPRIERVIDLGNQGENDYLIEYNNHTVFIKNGVVQDSDKLSSGTAEGIGIADMITAMRLKAIDFYYCDEKFSHIHSSSECAFLSTLIDMLGPNQQMIFTTHNSDVLEMNLPFHTFAFLRRNNYDANDICCVYASDYLKKNNQSLKNAVDNDLFLTEPNTDSIFNIAEML